jgi:uncharacterized protein YbaR (Trm112 family)
VPDDRNPTRGIRQITESVVPPSVINLRRSHREPVVFSPPLATYRPMKESLMDILCDPLDKSDLELEVDERDGDEIIEGRLIGTVTGEVYPIEDGIPNLLPPDMRDED